jgi:hypothetical protein
VSTALFLLLLDVEDWADTLTADNLHLNEGERCNSMPSRAEDDEEMLNGVDDDNRMLNGVEHDDAIEGEPSSCMPWWAFEPLAFDGINRFMVTRGSQPLVANCLKVLLL